MLFLQNMKTLKGLYWLYSALCAVFLYCSIGCSDGSLWMVRQASATDSLNDLAYTSRYRSLDACESYARQALESADERYDVGIAEAKLNLAFVHYMRMQYDSARHIYDNVIEDTDDNLLALMAEVNMMRISRRLAANKEFYDYRILAMKHMEDIKDDVKDMSDRRRKYWLYACSEFHIVSVEYYYGLRQEAQAEGEFLSLSEYASDLRTDSAQLTRYYLLLGINDMIAGGSAGEEDVRFKNIVHASMIGRNGSYNYLLSESMIALAEEMIGMDSIMPYRLDNIKRLLHLTDVHNDSLPLTLGQKSLLLAQEYGSVYLESLANLTISSFYFREKQFDVSLHYAKNALALLEEYNLAGREQPYWIATVRERLSMIYSALGQKSMSDANRNVYLDILYVTRQDMEMQQRLETLKAEEQDLNILLCCLAAGVLLMLVVGFSVWRMHIKRRKKRVAQLSDVVRVCESMSSYVPEEDCEAEVVESELRALVDSDVRALFPSVDEKWEEVGDKLNRYEKVLLTVVNVFFDKTLRNRMTYLGLDNTQREIEGETYLHEKHIEDKKRDWIVKLTCLSIVNGIMPFLERAVNEVVKLRGEMAAQDSSVALHRLDYIGELFDKINEYNDVVSKWVVMKHGAVSLKVENFDLQSMFDTLSKSRTAFDAKHITLNVESTDAVVKADKALTFFMINTLLDNARKYTPEGGSVTLGTNEDEHGVEIYVRDTGRGLSDEDIAHLLNDKVYDSAKIGDVDNDQDLKRNKGFGFGLMSCKGIIDKYKKTSGVFAVCKFDIKSRLGEGSVFSFRLPIGGVKNVVAFLLTTSILSSCTVGGQSDVAQVEGEDDAEAVYVANDSLLLQAAYYADRTYYSNIDGNYAKALEYVDSAISVLNAYYLTVYPDGEMLMTLDGERFLPEIQLCIDGFSTGYNIILDIRNEAAIAALALHRWRTYQYNNEIYTRLYKLLAQDTAIDGECNVVDESNESKRLLIVFLWILLGVIIVIVILLLVYWNYLGNKKLLQLKYLNDMGGKVDEKSATAIYIRQLCRMVADIDNSDRETMVRREEIELLEDEKRRAKYEENMIHIHNLVLDNCLSTIKHETMYYPNRIKQLVDKVKATADVGMNEEYMEKMYELVSYYKEIFTLLSHYASSQLQGVVFKRRRIDVKSVFAYMAKVFERMNRKHGDYLKLDMADCGDAAFWGDEQLVQFLVYNLMNLAFDDNQAGELGFCFDESDEFVTFAFTDNRGSYAQTELDAMFYPDWLANKTEADSRRGFYFLICKQIVREHDERALRRGCRICAESIDKGYRLVITLSKR